MSNKKKETTKSLLDELKLDLEILDKTDLGSVVGGKNTTTLWGETGIPGTVPQ